MKRHRRVTILAALVAAQAIGGSAAADAPLGWKAVAASGAVESRIAQAVPATDPWQPVRRGDRLPFLAEVRTGERGRTTLVHGIGLLLVDPNSRLTLPASTGDRGPTIVNQESGSVIYEVDGRSRPDFRVETPFLVAGVKGTVFLVEVTDDSATVTVRYGEVEILSRSGGERRAIRAGESARVGAASADRIQPLLSPGRRETPDAAIGPSLIRQVRHQRHRLDAAAEELRYARAELARHRRDPGGTPDPSPAASGGLSEADRLLGGYDAGTVGDDPTVWPDLPVERVEEQVDVDTRSTTGSASQGSGRPPAPGR